MKELLVFVGLGVVMIPLATMMLREFVGSAKLAIFLAVCITAGFTWLIVNSPLNRSVKIKYTKTNATTGRGGQDRQSTNGPSPHAHANDSHA
jgi:hypothetical protein